jgi:short-subunit dehydrogenase
MKFKKNIKMKNKSIVIFGSSGDVGLSLAKNYLDQGYNLVLTYNKNLKSIKRRFKFNQNNKSQLFFVKCNFKNEGSIKNVLKFTFKKIGEPSIIINSVGIFYYDKLNNFNYKKITDTFKINTFSVLSINKALYQLKKKSNITKVISIGSSSALNGFKDTYSYCGSKHALLGIIKSLNETIYNKNIFNYCLNFGSIKNKMGKKVRRGNYKKFINQNSVVKTANLITSLEFPAFPEEIYLKRFKY